MAEVVRAAAYVRVSSRGQEDGHSLAEQEDAIRHYAEAKGWEVVAVHQDVASGAKDDRPGLVAMLDRLDEYDRVIVWKLSRLARSARRSLEVAEQLRAAGIGLATVTDGFDTSTASGRLVFGILASVAEVERENISEQSRVGQDAHAREGKWGRGAPPYGYRLVGEKRQRILEEDAHEAEVVREMYERAKRDESQRDIAMALNRSGRRTRRMHRTTRDDRGRSYEWSQAQVGKILRSTTYLGWLTHRDETVKDAHPALIDEDTWLAVQVAVGERAKRPGRGVAALLGSRSC